LADITKYCHPERSEGPAFAASITHLVRFLFKLRHYRFPTISDLRLFWVYTGRPVSGLALLLGTVLAVIVATRPSEKLLFSATLKVIVALLCSIFATFIVFIAMHSRDTGSYLIGQVFGCVIIIMICVAIGNAVRKRKGKKIGRHS
jgi:CDP-diglyceride synthetase